MSYQGETLWLISLSILSDCLLNTSSELLVKVNLLTSDSDLIISFCIIIFFSQYSTVRPLGLQAESSRRRRRGIPINGEQDGQKIRRTHGKWSCLVTSGSKRCLI